MFNSHFKLCHKRHTNYIEIVRLEIVDFKMSLFSVIVVRNVHQTKRFELQLQLATTIKRKRNEQKIEHVLVFNKQMQKTQCSAYCIIIYLFYKCGIGFCFFSFEFNRFLTIIFVPHFILALYCGMREFAGDVVNLCLLA